MRRAIKLRSAIRGVVYLATYNYPSSANSSLPNSSLPAPASYLTRPHSIFMLSPQSDIINTHRLAVERSFVNARISACTYVVASFCWRERTTTATAVYEKYLLSAARAAAAPTLGLGDSIITLSVCVYYFGGATEEFQWGL